MLLGALFLLFVAQIYWYSRYLAAPARRLRRKSSEGSESSQPSEMPGVSVVLCAHNEGYNLSQYLQALLSQDYPLYEVIVVDDESEDNTRDVVEQYSAHDARLRMTFVPYGARVGSTKKLALTLAAKSAKYEYLLLTDADCVPESNRWIREMMSGFIGRTDRFRVQTTDRITSVVLGFSPYFAEEGHINRMVRFETLFNGLHYLGAALCGHPYMGVGRNLAYKKSLFFESGGFTHQMTRRAGDDDLFVNHVATRENTAVVLDPKSYMWSITKHSFKDWWQQKRRHLSVSPAYTHRSQFRLSIEPLTRGLFYAMMIYIGIQYSAFSIPFIAAVGLFLVRWLVQTVIINLSARRMGLERFNMFSILWFDITLPLVYLYMLLVPRRQVKW